MQVYILQYKKIVHVGVVYYKVKLNTGRTDIYNCMYRPIPWLDDESKGYILQSEHMEHNASNMWINPYMPQLVEQIDADTLMRNL